MVDDARKQDFDIVLSENIDRLSRRVADIASLQDELSFHNIVLHTISSGEITPLLAGILGSISQQFLQDLRDKTHRDLLGRVLDGKSGGGIAYGYRVREGSTGERDIVDDEARIVRRIFEDYANGMSPQAIAKKYNREGIPGPEGREWRDTTIRGQANRGTGLLYNDLYIGRLVWNRCSYVKNPRTGKRLARPNPSHEWEMVELPEMRIIDEGLWNKVKARQKSVRTEITWEENNNPLNCAHRRKFMFSGLLKCGVCGGGYTIIGKDRYGCATYRAKGTCKNKRTIKRQIIEDRILSGLEERLMAPDMLAVFIKEFTSELNRLADEAGQSRRAEKRELATVERKIKSILIAVEDGMYTPSMKERLMELEARKAELGATLSEPEPPVLRIHPNLAKVYAEKIANLADYLNEEGLKSEATEVIRSLVDKAVLHPEENGPGLKTELYGDLAQILTFCEGAESQKVKPAAKSAGCQLSVVAGARNTLYRTRITWPKFNTSKPTA